MLFPAFSSDYRSANAGVGRVVSGQPGRFSGYAMVDAARDRGRIRAMVAEAVTGWVRAASRCTGTTPASPGRSARRAWSFALPVLYDVMGEVSAVEMIALEYPQVAFIIPHLGSFADDWRAQRQMIDVLARHPNVYTDTAGVRRFDLLAEALRRAGPGKMLFGTDGPWLHPGVELSKVLAFGLPAGQRHLVLGGELAAAHRSG